jgi:hypothetical protein
VAQRAIVMVLEAVCEQEFLACSYGFRPGRSAHQALQDLRTGFMSHGLRRVPDIRQSGQLVGLERASGVGVGMRIASRIWGCNCANLAPRRRTRYPVCRLRVARGGVVSDGDRRRATATGERKRGPRSWRCDPVTASRSTL